MPVNTTSYTQSPFEGHHINQTFRHAYTVFPRNLVTPRNLAACFCKLIPINTALKIWPHGKGSPAIYVYMRIIRAYK